MIILFYCSETKIKIGQFGYSFGQSYPAALQKLQHWMESCRNGKWARRAWHWRPESPLKFCCESIFFEKSLTLDSNDWRDPWTRILAWRHILCPTWCNLNKKAELGKLMMKLTLPVVSRHQVIWVSQTQLSTSWWWSDKSVFKHSGAKNLLITNSLCILVLSLILKLICTSISWFQVVSQ